jgi:hypothetical protein
VKRKGKERNIVLNTKPWYVEAHLLTENKTGMMSYA